eukprot:CAMPEP_0177159260 /NCGR_PEP_ID=MMETSP0367-20130122/4219_1 /TAXON_ID=447022 ORGANISM="Scrippsiella hangoei-like, Strain SHHI-4" /NCGR_SAMPLE_ID=MMETSP0367 /ASSEMBLY_ACC=CAM_ASM_000362 /LENGTH=325 /DNA_ID=CAMNT_0018604877 /DNA_START=15 /DNA_END=993 /DNA_ORIENTATION=-
MAQLAVQTGPSPRNPMYDQMSSVKPQQEVKKTPSNFNKLPTSKQDAEATFWAMPQSALGPVPSKASPAALAGMQGSPNKKYGAWHPLCTAGFDLRGDSARGFGGAPGLTPSTTPPNSEVCQSGGSSEGGDSEEPRKGSSSTEGAARCDFENFGREVTLDEAMARPCTVMLKNIPCRLSSEQLERILERFELTGLYDFVYVPAGAPGAQAPGDEFRDGFIGFRKPEHIQLCFDTLHGKPLEANGGGRVVQVAIATTQGYAGPRGKRRMQKESRSEELSSEGAVGASPTALSTHLKDFGLPDAPLGDLASGFPFENPEERRVQIFSF